MYKQLITPDPDINCNPGWCLQYVRQTYDLPVKFPTATAAWEASTSQHHDTNFPADVWVPVWFSLQNEPAGHVALRAPDGSVYSTSDFGNKPHHHATLDDLMSYYAYYGMPLTYLGWTEDVAGYPVITQQKVELEMLTDDDIDKLAKAILNMKILRENSPITGTTSLRAVIANYDAGVAGLVAEIRAAK